MKAFKISPAVLMEMHDYARIMSEQRESDVAWKGNAVLAGIQRRSFRVDGVKELDALIYVLDFIADPYGLQSIHPASKKAAQRALDKAKDVRSLFKDSAS